MVQSSRAEQPFRLVMILFRYFPWGGMQANFLRVAKACAARGHIVDVYTLDWQGELEAELNINVVQVSGRSNIVRYERFFKRLQPILEAKNYDLVMGFNRMPGLDLYYAADPCFVERVRKTRPWYYPLTARYRHFRRVEADLFAPKSGTRILALSASQIDEYTFHYDTPPERFKLLPPSVQQRYRRGENALQLRTQFREKHGIKESEWVLLMIGSDYQRKGMDRTLRAVAALPPEICALCRVFVVGKIREKPLRRLSSKLGLASQLTIVPGTHDIPLYLQGADLLLHPARSENTGNVIVEAIAAGLPVLCSGACGYAGHVFRAGAGQVVNEPFQQNEMNHLLVAMLNPRALASWQKNALDYAVKEDLYSRTPNIVKMIEDQVEKRHVDTRS